MTKTSNQVSKAVIPTAGRGTRFLPVTKVVPKELLPIMGRPSIDFVVEEATDAGIEDVLFVTRQGKEAVVDYFDVDVELEELLAREGKTDLLNEITRYQNQARVTAVRQGIPAGLGHAIAQAEKFVGDSPFAVLLPDDLMSPRDPLLQQMIAARERVGGSVVALLEVTKEQAVAYGSAAVTPVPIPSGLDIAEGDLLKITDLIEKPAAHQILSNVAVVGRYVLDPAIFPVLASTPPGRGGEIQLTDALARMIDIPAEEGGGVHGVIVRGARYDTGTPIGYLDTYLRLALKDPDIGADVKALLADLTNI